MNKGAGRLKVLIYVFAFFSDIKALLHWIYLGEHKNIFSLPDSGNTSSWKTERRSPYSTNTRADDVLEYFDTSIRRVNSLICHWGKLSQIIFLPRELSGQRDIVVAYARLSVRPSVHKLYIFPHENLSHIWAEIILFAPNMYHGILTTCIENNGHWPWPLR